MDYIKLPAGSDPHDLSGGRDVLAYVFMPYRHVVVDHEPDARFRRRHRHILQENVPEVLQDQIKKYDHAYQRFVIASSQPKLEDSRRIMLVAHGELLPCSRAGLFSANAEDFTILGTRGVDWAELDLIAHSYSGRAVKEILEEQLDELERRFEGYKERLIEQILNGTPTTFSRMVDIDKYRLQQRLRKLYEATVEAIGGDEPVPTTPVSPTRLEGDSMPSKAEPEPA